MNHLTTEEFLRNYIIKGNAAIQKLDSNYFIQNKEIIDNTEDKAHRNQLNIVYFCELYYSLSRVCFLADFIKSETLEKYKFNEIEIVNIKKNEKRFLLTNYIISIDTIEYLINENIKKKIIISVETNMIYYIIDYYLSIQIFKCLLEKYRIINTASKSRISISSIKQSLYNIRNRKKYKSKKVLTKSIFDVLWAELGNYEIIHKQLNITYEEFYRNSLSKTDDLLLPILLKFIKFNDKYSENEVLDAMFPLFCYLMPHEKWCKSETEYKKSEDGNGKTFREYKIARMRRIINKK